MQAWGFRRRLGHRASIDFGFFARDPLDHHALERAIPWLSTSDALQEEPNAKTVLVRAGGGTVKVSLFGNIAFGRVGEPDMTEEGTLRVASLLDLAGTGDSRGARVKTATPGTRGSEI